MMDELDDFTDPELVGADADPRRAALARYQGMTEILSGLQFSESPDVELDPDVVAAAGMALRAAREAYVASLTPLDLSRSPLTEQVLSYVVDTHGFDGLWWDLDEPARALDPIPSDLVALKGAVTLAEPVEYTPHLVKPGPAVPYVVPELLEVDGVTAVFSAVGIGRHAGYVIAYFAESFPVDRPRSNTWGRNDYDVAEPDGGRLRLEEPEIDEDLDFDLGPWLDRGKVQWIEPGDPYLALRTGREDCPYLDLPGTREIQRMRAGQVWTMSSLP